MQLTGNTPATIHSNAPHQSAFRSVTISDTLYAPEASPSQYRSQALSLSASNTLYISPYLKTQCRSLHCKRPLQTTFLPSSTQSYTASQWIQGPSNTLQEMQNPQLSISLSLEKEAYNGISNPSKSDSCYLTSTLERSWTLAAPQTPATLSLSLSLVQHPM